MGTFPQGQGLHTAKQVLICWGQAQDVVMLLHLLWLKRVIQSPEICLHRETSWSFIPFKICPLLPRCHSSRSEVKGRREVMNYCCSGFTCSEVNWRASVIVPSFHLFLKLYFKNMNFLPLHTTRRLMINWDFKISLLDFLFILQVFFPLTLKKGGLECSQKRDRTEALAAPACLRFLFLFNGSHTPLTKSVSDFQGMTLLLHQTFPSSCCCLARLLKLKLIFH